MQTAKAHSAQTKTNSVFDDWISLVTPFSSGANHFDQIIVSQRRNYEAITKVAQLATESLNTVFHRQVEIADALARGGADGLTGLRELSDILTKANAEAGDLLAKRIGEGLTELRTAFAAA